ncbi:drug/metabolite exporter YedA [Tenacibaculum sp. KUL113]|uniref:EamA family transporter n=1 Tax=Tenacibaculum sp. XPcli2-G TaxID=2954503 RepID=UPI0012E59D08|nr:EamA family transporter [Tenacibaculum sp. XPcli2-G]MCO7185698.1 EamA family transporter [Tenacibaculum sp. XPcli2-G]GFD76568.1 drug/metabolite exporter YedA [Tenacibaculum sp. KUL113]
MKESKPLIIAAFIAIYVIWGSTYLLNKIVVTEVSPLLLAAIRFSISGALIMLIAKFLKVPITVTKKQLLNSAIAGFLFLVYGNGMFVWALKFVDSGFGALLAATQPLFVLLLLRLIDGKKMQRQSIIGVVLGIIGMYLLVSQNEITTSKDMLIGIFMIFSCVLSWSYGSVFVSKAKLPKNFFVSTGYQMLFAGGLLFTASLLLGENWSSPLDWSFKAQGAMFLLIVFGSIVAFTSFNYLLKIVPTEKVSTSAYVNPVVALFLGWYFLDETLTTQSVIASIVLLSGVYFITSRKRISKLKVTSKPQEV